MRFALEVTAVSVAMNSVTATTIVATTATKTYSSACQWSALRPVGSTVVAQATVNVSPILTFVMEMTIAVTTLMKTQHSALTENAVPATAIVRTPEDASTRTGFAMETTTAATCLMKPTVVHTC